MDSRPVLPGSSGIEFVRGLYQLFGTLLIPDLVQSL